MSAPSAKRKGRRHGAVMMVWLFFANLFDPARGAAIEQIDMMRRTGDQTRRTDAAAAGRRDGAA